MKPRRKDGRVNVYLTRYLRFQFYKKQTIALGKIKMCKAVLYIIIKKLIHVYISIVPLSRICSTTFSIVLGHFLISQIIYKLMTTLFAVNLIPSLSLVSC